MKFLVLIAILISLNVSSVETKVNDVLNQSAVITYIKNYSKKINKKELDEIDKIINDSSVVKLISSSDHKQRILK